ncbi:MAG: acyloxyacyl hydrolase [Pseudomonadota bacterium]
MFLSSAVLADELSVNAGFGGQAGAGQDNWGGGLDWEFWRHARSERQFLSIGAGYTHIRTDAATNKKLSAFSLYPQLTLLANKRNAWQPYFFVRALGPTFLSSEKLGEREQGERFAFQAQVGGGLIAPSEDWFVALSYKHFSNAELFSPNDSMEIQFLVTVGKRW